MHSIDAQQRNGKTCTRLRKGAQERSFKIAMLVQRQRTVMHRMLSHSIAWMRWYRKWKRNDITLMLLIGNVKRCDGFERAHIQIFVWIDACRRRATVQTKNALCDRNDLEWLNMICVVVYEWKNRIFFSLALFYLIDILFHSGMNLSVFSIRWCNSIISDCSSGINGCVYHYFNFNYAPFAQFSTTFLFCFRLFFCEKSINPKSCRLFFPKKYGKKRKTAVLMRNTMKRKLLPVTV